MIQWMFWWASLLGPILFILLFGLYLARFCFKDERILFEISEPIVAIAAVTLTAAIAGLIVVLV